ncbi:MAG: hypothetical protein WBK28_00460 [Minisyncoccia bacterium]
MRGKNFVVALTAALLTACVRPSLILSDSEKAEAAVWSGVIRSRCGADATVCRGAFVTTKDGTVYRIHPGLALGARDNTLSLNDLLRRGRNIDRDRFMASFTTIYLYGDDAWEEQAIAYSTQYARPRDWP